MHAAIIDARPLACQAPDQLKPGQLAKRKHQITDVLHMVSLSSSSSSSQFPPHPSRSSPHPAPTPPLVPPPPLSVPHAQGVRARTNVCVCAFAHGLKALFSLWQRQLVPARHGRSTVLRVATCVMVMSLVTCAS